VTHLLLQGKIDQVRWSAEYLAPVLDPVLNRAMGRPEPFYLYALNDAIGRASHTAGGTIDAFESTGNQVTVTYTAPRKGELWLRDLSYPGWQVTLDGQILQQVPDELFRRIEAPGGTHTVEWTFRPASLKWGSVISVVSLLVIVSGSWLAYRRRRMCALPKN
jgi:uncharacterized membrane protein YfhO